MLKRHKLSIQRQKLTLGLIYGTEEGTEEGREVSGLGRLEFLPSLQCLAR